MILWTLKGKSNFLILGGAFILSALIKLTNCYGLFEISEPFSLTNLKNFSNLKRFYQIRDFPYLAMIIAFAAICISCQNKKNHLAEKELTEISFRMEREPLSLSPILSRTSRDREVHEYIFISLGDYDPVSLEIVPVMIEALPTISEIKEGPYKGGESYKMRILDEATWADGTPITGKDVLFTIKMVAHPEVATSWKSLLGDIYDIAIDEEDPKKLEYFTSGDYYLNSETIISAEIYPAHIYDPNDVMSDISLPELKNTKVETLQEEYPAVIELAKEFSSSKYQKEIVEGAGPYKLLKWESGQYIILEKKENYWGASFQNNTLLKAIPERMIFQIVPDENVALTLLKNDELDYLNLAQSPYVVFDELKADPDLTDELDFYTVQVPRSYWIMMNNQDPRLSNLEVRKAISLLTDRNRILNQIEGGYGQALNSIVHPIKKVYNDNLPDPQYDITAANKILEASGWRDTDNNGIRDKIINGKKEELSFDFLVTNSTTSANISSILKSDWEKAGIKLSPIVKSFGSEIFPALNAGDYELSVMISVLTTTQFPDPYIRWHSDQIEIKNGNLARYNNPELDAQIEIIRSDNATSDERKTAYYELQEIMAADYPVLFLYTPQYRIVVDEDIQPVLTSKSPGYVANAFSLR